MEYENNPEIVQDHNIKILWDRDTVEKAIIDISDSITKKFKDAANIEFDEMDIEDDLRDSMTEAAEDLKITTNPKSSVEKTEKKKSNVQKSHKPKNGDTSKLGKVDG